MKLLMNLVYTLLLCLQANLYGCQTLLEMPIVGLEMSEEGMHRELTYKVQFDYPFAGKDCEYVLEQRLPAAVYVSVDQLDDLKRLHLLEAFYPKYVDIEASTERALPFSVLLLGVPKITDTITLPIHFRYHAADNMNLTVRVEIDTPTLYMNCLAEHNDWLEEELEQLESMPHSKYCLDIESSSFGLTSSTPATTHLNPFEETLNCHWRKIRVQLQLNSPLQAEIPKGNKQLYYIVLYGSILISWTASLWLLWSTCAIPRRINQKLKDQHALEQKIK